MTIWSFESQAIDFSYNEICDSALCILCQFLLLVAKAQGFALLAQRSVEADRLEPAGRIHRKLRPAHHDLFCVVTMVACSATTNSLKAR